MEDAISTWLPPAIIIGVMVTFITSMSRSLNKRIDDLRSQMIEGNNALRSQMTREHDALAQKVDTLTEVVMNHVTDYSIHNIKKTTPE